MRARIEDIVRATASHFGLAPREIYSASRCRYVCFPRMVVMQIARENGYSLPTIGNALGGRDHTTVLHGLSRIPKLIEAGEVLVMDLVLIRRSVDVWASMRIMEERNMVRAFMATQPAPIVEALGG